MGERDNPASQWESGTTQPANGRAGQPNQPVGERDTQPANGRAGQPSQPMGEQDKKKPRGLYSMLGGGAEFLQFLATLAIVN